MSAKTKRDENGGSRRKKIKTSVDLMSSVVFTISQDTTELLGCIKAIVDLGLNLAHIESRTSSKVFGALEYLVSIRASHDEMVKVVNALKKVAKSVSLVVDREKDDPTDPMWYPKCIRDLDEFAHRVLDAGKDLNADHPGFTDAEYRKRRAYFADIAINYRHGTPIPTVEYTDSEKKTWNHIFTSLENLYPTHACREFNEVFDDLRRECGYRADNIPQLEDISNFLHSRTGFRLRPVAGLLSSRDFLAGLAFRVFHSTQYVRHPSKPDYTPEPDICHEILGHVPLFADPDFAVFSQEIGLASLGASDEDVKRLATCYWFTVEFGVCREGENLRAYGAGLLSSFGELEYCLSGKPKLQPFDPKITGVTEYPITEFQPLYYVAESFKSAKEKLSTFAATLDKPFSARYNPYTESIELLFGRKEIKNLAHSIQYDLQTLCHALKEKS